jgi:hypothetical protein
VEIELQGVTARESEVAPGKYELYLNSARIGTLWQAGKENSRRKWGAMTFSDGAVDGVYGMGYGPTPEKAFLAGLGSEQREYQGKAREVGELLAKLQGEKGEGKCR